MRLFKIILLASFAFAYFTILMLLLIGPVNAAGSMFQDSMPSQPKTIPATPFDCNPNHKCLFDKGGLFHQEGDIPALTTNSGMYWFTHGWLDRKDRPAIIYMFGAREYWRMGKRHREGGPAFETKDGYKEWWVDGEFVWACTSKYFNTCGLAYE